MVMEGIKMQDMAIIVPKMMGWGKWIVQASLPTKERQQVQVPMVATQEHQQALIK